jgi:hypothetical protein
LVDVDGKLAILKQGLVLEEHLVGKTVCGVDF